MFNGKRLGLVLLLTTAFVALTATVISLPTRADLISRAAAFFGEAGAPQMTVGSSKERSLARQISPSSDLTKPPSISLGPQGAFSGGNLVVDRVGDGTTTLSGAAFPVSLVEITTAGVATLNVISMPTAGSANQGGFTDSGTATANGHLNLSANGAYLLLGGYDAPIGVTGVANTTASAIDRNIAKVDNGGNVSIVAKLTDAFSGNGTSSAGDPRSVTSDTGASVYMAGDSSSAAAQGARYADVSSGVPTTSTQISSANYRDVAISKDSSGTKVLTVSGSSSIMYFPGFPTSTATATSIGIAFSNVGGYLFLDRDPSTSAPGLAGLDTLYVADGAAGVKKYEWNGSSTWVLKGSVVGSYFGLAGRVNGANVDLFVTTAIASNNKLQKITDTSGFGGSIAGTTPTDLISAGLNHAFRGVAFAPTGAPAVSSLVATSITSSGATLNGSVDSDGGSPVTERGFYYRLGTGVTTSDTKIVVSGTTGAFAQAIGGLNPGTQYSFKAYAMNAVGTTLSSEQSFNTAASSATVTVSAPALVKGAGMTFTTAISLSDPSNVGVGSYQFNIDYDPTIVTPTGANAGCSNVGTLPGTAGQSVTCNTQTTADPHVSTLLVSDFGSTATSGSGTLLNVTFAATTTGPFPRSSSLHFHDAFFFMLAGPLTVVTTDGSAQITGTTAANVAVSGRVLDAAGAPVRGVRVRFIAANGITFTTVSNAFGLYRLDAVPSGAAYTATVTARGLTYAPRVIHVNDAITGLDLTPQ